MKLRFVLSLFFTLPCLLVAQSPVVLEDCGQSYIDPQDDNGGGNLSQDTLIYTELFDELNQARQFYVDVNAFGGQQVDRVSVYAILPDNSTKSLGSLAFGNCFDCVQGFALMVDGLIEVEQVSDQNTMDLWLLSFSQPPFTLTGNLQTLSGVGRISGKIPFCAIGWKVEYSVFSDPGNSTTEFSTHILCPEITMPCTTTQEVEVDCIADSIRLMALLPEDCFAAPTQVRWRSVNGLELEGTQVAAALTGNEGWWYLEVSDECCTYVDSFLVENPPFADAGPDQMYCQGEDITLSGAGGMGHFWEILDGAVLNDSIAILPDAQGENTGTYILHAFSEEGCEDTDSLFLLVDVPPDIKRSTPRVCLGDTVFFRVLNEEDYVLVEWISPDGIVLPGGFVPNMQLSDFGIYTVQATDTAGCLISETFNVEANLLQLEYIFQESCDSTTVFVFPPELMYEWEDGREGPVYASSTGGIYQVTVTDADDCVNIEQVDIPPPDGPVADIEVEQPLCPGDFGRLEIDLYNQDAPVIFSIDGGQTYGLADIYERLLPDTYQVVVQDDLGCLQDFEVEILQPDTIAVSLQLEKLDVYPNTPVTLNASTIGSIQAYQWLPRSIDSGEASTSFIANSNAEVRIIVEDERGCKAVDGFQLTIVLGDIYIPNGFSPNEDGRNDRFTFYGDGLSGERFLLLQIFNRYGALVFELKDAPLNDESLGWDGTFKGEALNPGVYTYYGRVRFGDGSIRTFEGDITLVK